MGKCNDDQVKLEVIKAVKEVTITALTVIGTALTAYFSFKSNKSKD